jgi:hypothetical protein
LTAAYPSRESPPDSWGSRARRPRGNLDNVDVLFDAGFRMMSVSHFFDTDIGGSAHG